MIVPSNSKMTLTYTESGRLEERRDLDKVLITGATGFVGSHLADYLEGKYEVHGLIRPRSRQEFIRSHVTYHEADIQDYSGLSSIIRELQPKYIFHLAGQSFVPISWQAPVATFMTNALGTLNLLEAVRRESPGSRVQIAGTSEEYGLVLPGEIPITELNPLRPQSPYAVSKVAADLLAQQYSRSYKLKLVITRAFNHTGPRRGEVFVTSSIAKQIAMIEKGLKSIIELGDLSPKRDWTDVRDIVRAYTMSVEIELDCGPYNICSGEAFSVGDVLQILSSFSKSSIKFHRDESKMRPSDVPLLLGSNEKFRKATGWTPTIPFEITLLDLLNYWRSRT